MDKYDASNDHYCYPSSYTLKNRLDIRDIDALEAAEREITALTVSRVRYSAPPYSLNNFRTLHYQLFSDLYEWAGEIRDVDISKGGTRFCTWSRIQPEADKIFTNLQKNDWLRGLDTEIFCETLAEFYCELNMIHPFREGNGRVQRIFFEHLALYAGFELDWEDINATEWIQANIDGVAVDYSSMAAIFKRIVIAS